MHITTKNKNLWVTDTVAWPHLWLCVCVLISQHCFEAITCKISLRILASWVLMWTSPTWPFSYLRKVNTNCSRDVKHRCREAALLFYSHKEESRAHVIRYRTDPNVPMFLKGLWSYHCKKHTSNLKCQIVPTSFVNNRCLLPSQRAMQFRFWLCRKRAWPGSS